MRPLGIGILSGAASLSAVALSAQDFQQYCAQITRGEVLEAELTPENMAYIFDETGQVIAPRAEELRAHFRDGISEECGAGDIGAYVSQYGGRVMLEIYPAGQYPLGIEPATMEQIQSNYRQCIGEELEAVDENGNGLIDEGENARLYRSGERFCNEELAGSLSHAVEIAALNEAQVEAEARTEAARARSAAAQARIAAITDGLIADARKDVGL